MTPQSIEQSRSIPGRKWYAVAVLVFLVGMALFAVFLFARLSKLGDDLVRVTVPGQAELPLNSGSYTIFHERGGMTDDAGGGVITAGDITGLRISVQNPETGAAVPLTAAVKSQYTVHGRSGQSLFTFTLTEPGTYRLVATYEDGRSGPRAVLTLGRGIVESILTTVFVGLAIGFGTFASAWAIVAYVYSRRRSVLGPPIRYFPIWRTLLAFNLDFLTASLLGAFITELLTRLLAKSGVSLPVWPSVPLLAVIVGYFVLFYWQFGETLWQRILKIRSRPT